MPDNNLDEQIPAPELSESQKYVNEKVATLIDQIGDEYGESLTQQLVQRLDATVTDFHEEVTNMLSELKERTVSRQQKLRDAWDHRFDSKPESVASGASSEITQVEGAAQGDVPGSEWEKRLESMEAGDKAEATKKDSAKDDKKKKKKGLFGRKKK